MKRPRRSQGGFRARFRARLSALAADVRSFAPADELGGTRMRALDEPTTTSSSSSTSTTAATTTSTTLTSTSTTSTTLTVVNAARVRVAAGAVAPPAQAADKDCDDFKFQEDAQAVLDANKSDPNRLDGNDNDGLACESLPRRSTGGGGGTTATTRPGTPPEIASTGSDLGGTALAGTSLVLAGALLARSGRRRRELEEFRLMVFGDSSVLPHLRRRDR